MRKPHSRGNSLGGGFPHTATPVLSGEVPAPELCSLQAWELCSESCLKVLDLWGVIFREWGGMARDNSNSYFRFLLDSELLTCLHFLILHLLKAYSERIAL